MAQLTAFGKAAKKALIDRGQSQEWLIGEIKAATGQYVDGGYLYKIFTGQRSAPKVVQAICEILELSYSSESTA